jgi:hypothetical protein
MVFFCIQTLTAPPEHFCEKHPLQPHLFWIWIQASKFNTSMEVIFFHNKNAISTDTKGMFVPTYRLYNLDCSWDYIIHII